MLELILFIAISIAAFLLVQHLKKSHFEKSITYKMNSQIGKKYNISDNKRRLLSKSQMSIDPDNIQGSYKLVYEMNFDCGICFEDLKVIQSFYLELLSTREIAFYLISTEKSVNFVNYHIENSLDNYDLWVIQQEFTDDDIKLYLLDNLDNIIMAGDIIKYPFLKAEYTKKLKQF